MTSTSDLLNNLASTSYADCPTLRRGTMIERKTSVSSDEFELQHLQGHGLPVVVTDAMDNWAANANWSFEFFRSKYGADLIEANSPFFLEEDVGLSPVKVRFHLRDYIDYILNPSIQPRGEFLQGDWDTLQENGIPLYAPAYDLFTIHPELAKDVNTSPYFVKDMFAMAFPGSAVRFLDRVGNPVHYLFFGAAGSTAFLHADYWGTHAYLAQLAGRKLCVLFSPEDNDNLYRTNDCNALVRDPLRPNLARHPKFADTTPYCAILEPGDLLFVPSGWWHFVIGLETSLTYSYNFFTEHNVQRYFTHFFDGIGQILAGEYDPLPGYREALAALRNDSRAELDAILNSNKAPG